MYEITFKNGDEAITHENIADAMVVGNNLRFATLLGESNTIEDGKIEKARSSFPLKVKIKLANDDSSVTKRDCRFVCGPDEKGIVHIAFPNMRFEAYVGEIVRVRRQVLPT